MKRELAHVIDSVMQEYCPYTLLFSKAHSGVIVTGQMENDEAVRCGSC